MLKKDIKYLTLCVFLIIMALGLTFSYKNILAAWTPPTENPPEGGASAPINLGNASQEKLGLLTLSSGGNGLIVYPGKIGIQTSNPGGLIGLGNSDTYIDVYGNNLTFTDAVTGTKTLSELSLTGHGDFSSTGDIALDHRVLGNTDDYSLGFKTNDQVRLHISADGNVGVGVTNPGGLLSIKNGGVYLDVDAEGNLIFKDSNNEITRLQDLTAEGSGAFSEGGDVVEEGRGLGNLSFKDLSLMTNSTPRIYIKSTGDVGIGTENPGGLLGIGDSNSYITNNGGNLTFADNYNDEWSLYNLTSQSGEFADGGDFIDHNRTLGNTDDYNFSLLAGGTTPRVHINGGVGSTQGFVGIGTENPRAKLDVSGAVQLASSDICNEVSAGSLRYNSQIKDLQFCDGINWDTLPYEENEIDDNPNPFSVPAMDGAPNVLVTLQSPIALSGFEVAEATISGGGNPEISCNNGTNWSNSCECGYNCQLLTRLRVGNDGTVNTAIVAIGGVTAEWKVNTNCNPNCSGKECGDDGCGGSCGECINGQTCDNGNCLTVESGCETFTYGGQSYSTVLIGTQCWMASNLNVGTKLALGTTEPTNSGIIEKWCYDNDDAKCTTYGGLYNWNEMMQSSTTEGAQGICPTDWHIPTDEEYKNLEEQLGMSEAQQDAEGYRGTDEGSKLAGNASLWTDGVLDAHANFGDSGFDALPSGYRYTNGSFYSLGTYTSFWSSTMSGVNAWRRSLHHGNSTVYRNESVQAIGFSVRCLKD